MREPGFWYDARTSWSSLQSRLLTPLAKIYGAVAARRMARAGIGVGIPVVCIGNYHLGGAGKTPTTLALTNILRDLGELPFVVSRGYGGTQQGPLRVDPRHHVAADVGDEPLMLAGHVPVIVARARLAGAELARSEGASVILLDDGFQNPALTKDMSLIVIDGARALGNGRVFPAGPLRAPLPPQLARTDALVVIGQGRAADNVAMRVAARGGLVLRAAFKPDADQLSRLKAQRVLAFAGIGDPARFFATLRDHGVDVVEGRAFADHHVFSLDELAAMAAYASAQKLTLVTTEKDFARLRGDARLAPYLDRIVPFAVTLAIENEAALRGLVAERLARAR